MKQELNNNEFGTLAVCAVRYSLGRKSYMPDVVRGIIEPRIETMEGTALLAIANTINQPWNPKDLEKEWYEFEARIREELKRRGDYC